MKTKIEIIDETVAYYSSHPRSVTGSNCMYFTEKTDAKCAFSRCCTDEGVKELHENFEGRSVSQFIFKDFLKEEYRGHNSYFWKSIQCLHDSNEYWEGNSLTEEGQNKVNELKLLYS